MRVLFFGATEIGHRCCRQLLEMGEEVVGIFSIPERFQISYSIGPVRNVMFRSFEGLAADAGVPLIYVTGNMTDPGCEEAVRRLEPDFGLVIGWYYLIPKSLRQVFSRGVAGIHASLLPRYRGGAPLVWAIINGESATGVSLFYLADGVDDGDLIAQQKFPIGSDDDIRAVHDRAAEASVELISQYTPMIRRGNAPRIPQDNTQAERFPQRSPEDGLIPWETKSARQVHDWIRAQTRPYFGAYSCLEGERIVVWRSLLSDATAPPTAGPGTLVVNGDALSVSCRDGRLLELREVGLEDGSVATGFEFAKIRGLGTGQSFDAA